MAIPNPYKEDVRAILSKRHQNGADFWATPDGRWGKGSPFSTFDCVLSLVELGMARKDPVLRGAADALLASWKEDGRFRPAPKGTIYPCHTANAARALCRLGFARDRRLAKTFEHFFEVQHVLSHYRAARKDARFQNALRILESKLVDGQVVVENPNRGLAKLAFCRKGEPSQAATRRYREILKNLSRP